jgi:hypothetical protein
LKWLERCKKKHSDTCGTRENAIKSVLPRDFRVIDLEDHCIVSMPNDGQYLALSYVWGPAGITSAWLSKSNMSKLRTKRGLDTLQLPRTIKEAMEFTSQLNFRYLWVDALCVIQDPLGLDEHQIRAMDAICHCSQMTVVAAAGSDANAGLPGFGSHSRPPAIQNGTREADVLDREWFQPNFSEINTRVNLEQSRVDPAGTATFTKMPFHHEASIIFPVPLLHNRGRVWCLL